MRWDAGDWMIAVQWYSESDDGEYFRDEPCSDIFNSSELRLAGFPAEQSRGQRAINQRPRRGDQAAHQAELDAGGGASQRRCSLKPRPRAARWRWPQLRTDGAGQLEARPPCGVFLLLALCAAGAPLTLTGGAVVCGEVAWREGWCCAVVVVSQNRALWPAPPHSPAFALTSSTAIPLT